jgi:hypothetical protein
MADLLAFRNAQALTASETRSAAIRYSRPF